jgi:hypothetical protein
MMIFFVPWATRTWTTARPMGPPPRTRTEAFLAPMSRSGDAETACQATERGSTSAVVLLVFALYRGWRTDLRCPSPRFLAMAILHPTVQQPLHSIHHRHLLSSQISILFSSSFSSQSHDKDLPLKPINPPFAHAFSTPFLQAPQL